MLHIVNKSPLEKPTLDSAVRLAAGGTLLLIEDAVYAATRGNAGEAKVRQAMAKLKVCALMPDLQARGVADRLIDGVAAVDYDGFVDLVVEHKNCQSWL
ncbi:MAG: sulfurtransferase complex subunit TusB [Burkholderiales bacterium]|nr:MAG: sulfurtransferase complex subunit TusB [Burkholderiales bacterium]